MKILFVSLDVDSNEEYSVAFFPLGLSILAEITKKMNIVTELFDINKFLANKRIAKNILEEIAEEFYRISPDVIGYFTRCDILPRVIDSAKIVKQKMRNVRIFLGGPGVYGNEKEILTHFDFIELIIRGEGEKTIERIFRNKELKNIPGIAYRDNGKIVVTQDVDLIEDLDTVPIPQRGGKIRESDVIQIEAGRGCPYNCNFCSTSLFWKRKYRLQSPVRLVDELENIHRIYVDSKFTFLHDNLTVSEEYIEELVAEIKRRNLTISWGCCARIDNVNENIIRLLKEGGCEHIYFGIETGSEKMQKVIGKNICLDLIYKNMDICEKYKMDTTQSYVLGFPEESEEDINMTFQLAIRLANYECSKMVQLSYLQPTPNTRVTKEYFDKLYCDEKHIMLLQNRKVEKLPGFETNISLIKQYPAIFSSFYKIRLNHSFDLYRVVFCFSHFLIYYKKSLNIICNIHCIKPLDFYEYICNKCTDCNCHLNAMDATMGGDGVCKMMSLYLDELIPNMTELEKFIINYETVKRNSSINKEYPKNSN